MLTADKITKVAKTTEARPLRAPRARIPARLSAVFRSTRVSTSHKSKF
jgi:hypothetical protein